MELSQQQVDCARLLHACGLNKEDVGIMVALLSSSGDLEMTSLAIVDAYKTTGKFPKKENIFQGIANLMESRELHLNEDFISFDTPIHEFTHIWWEVVRANDKRITDQIVSLMKQTNMFKKLKGKWLRDKNSVYHGMSDEDIAQECFSRMVGKRGEEIMSEEGLTSSEGFTLVAL